MEKPLEDIYMQYLRLRTYTKVFADIQAQRIATYNVLGVKADGLPTAERPGALVLDPSKYQEIIKSLDTSEKVAQKAMLDAYHLFVPPEIEEWRQEHKGIGEHSLAKLFGYVGHPRIGFPFIWETDKDGKRNREPTPLPPFARRVSHLWQYSGVGEPGRRFAGMSAQEALRLGNPNAKKALWMITQGIIKANNSKYRTVYDQTRERYKDHLHTIECVRCTPAGAAPAALGTPLKDGHKHGIAVRKMMKEILRDIWIVTPIPEGITEINLEEVEEEN